MNLDFASVWETISDIIPDNDALICGEEVVCWKEYDLRSSKIASALSEAGLSQILRLFFIMHVMERELNVFLILCQI